MNSTPPVSFFVGNTLLATDSIISSDVTSPRRTTKAFGSSPASRSGTPITATSSMLGWEINNASSSAGGTWSKQKKTFLASLSQRFVSENAGIVQNRLLACCGISTVLSTSKVYLCANQAVQILLYRQIERNKFDQISLLRDTYYLSVTDSFSGLGKLIVISTKKPTLIRTLLNTSSRL